MVERTASRGVATLRIIAGELKGRRLVTPRGATTRPTADQVRIALMDTLAPRLPGARVLDLYAGAGGLGLEALSRGADHVTFVERDGRAVAALRKNLEALQLTARARILAGDVARALDRLSGAGERFDVVVLDPPYDTDLAARTLARLGAGDVAADGAVIVAQHFTKRRPPEMSGCLRAYRTRRFGETTLTFFRAGDYDAESRAQLSQRV